jgi:hypothetical protein
MIKIAKKREELLMNWTLNTLEEKKLEQFSWKDRQKIKKLIKKIPEHIHEAISKKQKRKRIMGLQFNDYEGNLFKVNRKKLKPLARFIYDFMHSRGFSLTFVQFITNPHEKIHIIVLLKK